jgi:DNA-binding CsgD family transcriptional regulator
VALLILARRSNIEIAEHFRISRHTARHHVQAVLTKLGVKSRANARRMLFRGDDSRRTS